MVSVTAPLHDGVSQMQNMSGEQMHGELSMDTDTRVANRRAIEALRAGVPNRDAVRALGSSQPAVEDRFEGMLTGVKQGFPAGKGAEGVLFAGDFGSGKSHLLEYLQHVALENNFISSKVVISRENPFYDTGRIYDAALQSAGIDQPAMAQVFSFAVQSTDDRVSIATRPAAVAGQNLRPPAVAGTFYPSDPQKMSAMLELITA